MRARRSSWIYVAVGCVAAGCTAITGSDLGNGLGDACETDDDCQGSSCVDQVCTRACEADEECPANSSCAGGICVPTGGVGSLCEAAADCATGACGDDGLCTKSCQTNSDCPEPSECFADFCQIPLEVGFIWVGVVEDQGWTKTHDDGRIFAQEKLPYLRADFVTNVFLPDDAQAKVDAFVADGKDVIVANSFSLRNPVSESADEHQSTDFLVCSGNVTKPNLGSYFARSYQAWFLAGYAAASKTQTERIGFVGSFVTPEIVRHIDAFTLGARRVNPDIVVEVRWEGFWFDLDEPVGGKYRETVLAEELLETGCDVIAHGSDNGRVVEAVEAASDAGEDVWSIGNDNIDACKLGPDSCIGVPYWNWGPMYVRIFEEMHRGTWDPALTLNDNIKVNPDEAVTYFGPNDELLSNDLLITLGEVRSDLADDPELVFRGPYETTGGQRSPEDIGGSETISDEELATMCWFVEGVVEKTDPDDPLSPDQPARVPWGDIDIPPGSGNKPDCRQNQ